MSVVPAGELVGKLTATSPGLLSEANFRSSSAKEWAITISCAVGVGRRIAIRIAGSVTAISQVGPYLATISASVGPGGIPGVGRGAANNSRAAVARRASASVKGAGGRSLSDPLLISREGGYKLQSVITFSNLF
jgi:hypothetical protein